MRSLDVVLEAEGTVCRRVMSGPVRGQCPSLLLTMIEASAMSRRSWNYGLNGTEND
jgi:hypothetical protein